MEERTFGWLSNTELAEIFFFLEDIELGPQNSIFIEKPSSEDAVRCSFECLLRQQNCAIH